MRKKLDIKLVLIGVLVHLVIFYSIFDVYFKSPLVHGMQPILSANSKQSPAKRLVLIVADGLRADSFYKLIDEDRSLFLSKKRKDESSSSSAVFGISNTQVPTESRPGHVAMIAGFYEDISAVAKGWKENPVEFDSFFNRSKYTWAWGSPDILNLFKKSSNNVFTRTYDANIENFASENASLLDTWVLHHFKKFLYHSEVNVTERKMLHEDGVVFFLHLLGIDTNGHSKKPHSTEYKTNIRVVDNIVREVEDKINEYFKNDNSTVFLFTSDHGMTDWGSHGSGDDSETLTPFVAWGAGVKAMHKEKNAFGSSMFSLKQADIASLMSILIGVPIPLNNIGKLPLGLLDISEEKKSLAFRSNALQIYEQLKIKYELSKKSTVFFKEFRKFKISDAEDKLRWIETHITNKKFEQAIEEINLFIDQSLAALDYYHKYHQFYLGTCIFFSCIGWIVFLLFKNQSDGLDEEENQSSDLIDRLFAILIVLALFLCYYQNFPLSFYVYTSMPLVLWRNVLRKWSALSRFVHAFFCDKVKNLLNMIFLIVGVEILVLAFTHRWLLSLFLLFYSVYLMIHLKTRSDQVKIQEAYSKKSLNNENLLNDLKR